MIETAAVRREPERGAVLVFVVLVMLALSLVAHGALVESLAELSASRAAARQLQAVSSARSAVQVALNVGGGAWMDSVGLGGAWLTGTVGTGPISSVTTLRRLDTEFWLVEGAALRRGVEVARVGRLAWSLDPLERVTALEGAVSVADGARVVVTGLVDVGAPTAIVPPMQPGTCDPWLDSLNAHYTAVPLRSVASLPPGLGEPKLGLLDVPALLAAASVTVSGVGTPAPLEAGGSCVVTDPWNWGDPDRPWRACGNLLPLAAAQGDLDVVGGSGQGMLVVDGTVTFSAGAHFRGLVVTSGGLRLDDGAVLEGLAVAWGGVTVALNGTLVGSACWAVRALAAQRDLLDRLIPLASVGWIGPL